ncbi:hypothetical protein GJV82_18215 [Cellulosimicrobium sp. BIT-GX5]|uniref:Uncharacterized protein n=1 Tax=Cellulosimicrobium composti TaxID=2672572 RepID=A0A6N7ZMZ8_9MICO|nr:hypothetical protein [Cellulosimicrobium composti]MTG90855.1 hypothetical protein [Cellulosimicrobium composti]
MSLIESQPATITARCTCIHSAQDGDRPGTNSQQIGDGQWQCGDPATLLAVWECTSCVHQHSAVLCDACARTRVGLPGVSAEQRFRLAEVSS